MNLYELFKKFETEFLAGHEKLKQVLASTFLLPNYVNKF